VAPSGDHHVDVAALIAIERARLLELLATTTEPDWQRPTPCPGWTVLGLCSHLVGDDLSLLSRHRDGHRGTPAPDGLTGAQFMDWLDDLQAAWVDAARRLSPRLVVALLEWAGPQVGEMVARQDPLARSASVSWAGPEPVPVWLDQLRELSECWIHRQQLLQALGRPADLRADLLGPILDGLRWAYPYRLAAVPGRAGDFVAIEVTGPVAATWYLVAAGPRWDLRPQAGARRVARLSMTTDQAWRVLTNNQPADEQARLALSGDAAVCEVLRRTRAIIGAPK
jgi:uncharacterized protein (TIGR03083 family)